MKTIAALVTDFFEDSEYTRPVEAFREAGHKVVPLEMKAGKTVKGKKQSTPVTIEKSLDDVTIDDFDALLIPGGFSPDKLRGLDTPVRFVREFVKSGKPVFMICHGPQLLITADVLRGRTITGWTSIIQDIKNAGATFKDEAVVEDGNLISSRNPGDLDAFNEACLKKLE
ncbi:MAG: type 1 glutamine amidotransferase domain-containing protein [Thermodesulfobacteriota bacterium]|nr:type 1 glutamine amidotransferase domain-containing protein [Thermodesulfobacteriota bacterium]